MTLRRALLGLVILTSVRGLAAGKPVELTAISGTASERREAGLPLRETGSYIRRYWHIPLYRVTLEVPDPREVAYLYQLSTGCGLTGPDWDEVAAFLLDPQNRIPLRVSMVIQIGLKAYTPESRILRGSLGRMGLDLDDKWRLKGATELQGEVNRFAEAVIGLSENRPGPYYRNRKKGDVYVLSLDGSGGATLIYQPAADNRAAQAGRTDFQDRRVVAALVRALLLPSEEDEGASSAALLQEVRDACAACGSEARPVQRGRI